MSALFSYNLNVSKSSNVTYLGYESGGNYSSAGDIYLITIFSVYAPNSRMITGISNTNYLQFVSSGGYSTTPSMVVAVKGNFRGVNSFTFKFTERMQSGGSTSTYEVDVTVSDAGTTTSSIKYLDWNGNNIGSETVYVGNTSDYTVKYFGYFPRVADSNNLYHDVMSWEYNYGSTSYTITEGFYRIDSNILRNDLYLSPRDYPYSTVSLTVQDYPTVGSSRSYTQNRCVSGSGATKFTIPSNPSQTYYTFNRFANSNNTVTYTAGQQLEASADYTVYARWIGYTFNIAYNINTPETTPSAISTSQVTYPNTFTLPSLTRPNYQFIGWSYNGNTYAVGTQFPIADYPNTNNATLTFTPIFSPLKYTVTFKDADGNVESSGSYDYGSTQSVPQMVSPPSQYTFDGWSVEGNTAIASGMGASATTFTVTVPVTFIRRFSYVRKLYYYNGTGWVQWGSDYTGRYPATITLPTASSSPRPTCNGYRIKGWSVTQHNPSPTVNPTSDNQTGQWVLSLSDNFNKMYLDWIPATLESITLLDSMLVKEGQTATVNAVIVPSDWLGTLSWESSDGGANLTLIYNDRTSVNVYGKDGTENSPKILKAEGKKELWDTSEHPVMIQSNNMYVSVAEYIEVEFWTRNDNGELIEFTKQDHTGSSWYVYKDVDTIRWEALDGSTLEEEAYPGDAVRNGYVFCGWLDADGNLVTFDKPPTHKTVCYSSWTQMYDKNLDRDALFLQKLNADGDGMMLQIDMGLLSSLRENFEMSLLPVTTPTMSSDNTFITDMYCTENIIASLVRKSPINPNDSSDNPLNWSNAHWLEVVRGELVDRWQSETDGIKVLYIPRGIRIPEDENGNLVLVNGEIVCYGDNYDLLGYAVKRYNDDGSIATNLGLIFKGPKYDADGVKDEYILQGYNAIISAYDDAYTAESISAISVGMTFLLGGMRVEYQDFADGLLLK